MVNQLDKSKVIDKVLGGNFLAKVYCKDPTQQKRTLMVRTVIALSTERPLAAGVPQGGFLAPVPTIAHDKESA